MDRVERHNSGPGNSGLTELTSATTATWFIATAGRRKHPLTAAGINDVTRVLAGRRRRLSIQRRCRRLSVGNDRARIGERLRWLIVCHIGR